MLTTIRCTLMITAMRNRARVCGFTLIEILSVMSILVIFLSIATPAVIDWGRASRMRAARTTVQSSLGLAREVAMAHSREVTWYATNLLHSESGALWLEFDEALYGQSNRLGRGLVFDINADMQVAFNGDGTLKSGDAWIGIFEESRGEGGLVSSVRVYRVTGETEIWHTSE
jgi:prepilin-type N-terminal cleavage/methylation domain-containing protein